MSGPFDDPILGGLLGDPDLATILSAARQLQRMIGIEAAYALALGEAGVIVESLARDAASRIAGVQPDADRLRNATARDGVAVPELVRQIRAALPERLHVAVHKGLTSQDVIDTAFVLAARDALTLYETRIRTLVAALGRLSERQGSQALMGRTRMQAAVEITVADRIAAWATPWPDHLDRLSALRPRLLRLQMGGAAGNRAALGEHGDAVAKALAEALDLGNPPRSWHAARDNLGEFASWLSLVTGTLGKMGQDIALMSQQGLDEIRLRGGGGSSAMPHKQNPVGAELLVTLARLNATLLGGLHQALIHEQERSGSAWTLEWLILPQMMMATGRALAAATELLGNVDRIGAS